jgi:hypothetical protein
MPYSGKGDFETEKGERKMNKKILTGMLVFLNIAFGYVLVAGASAAEKATPVINHSFASKEVRPGDLWKIYLKVSDPNGEMKNIYAMVTEPGIGQYPLSIIRVKNGERKELSGYIYLNTFSPNFPLDYVTLTLTVQVQDRSGTFSEPAIFQLAMDSRYSQEAPPQGVFKEEALGPIMIQLRTPGGDDGRSGSGNFS